MAGSVKSVSSGIRPVYLCVLDGFALGQKVKGNAIYQAVKSGQAPFLAKLFAEQRCARLACSGPAVGLPPGTMGNSEVNHMNMGAGRVVFQSIERINVATKDGSFFTNDALRAAVDNCRSKNSTLHLMGILQGDNGRVHGDIEHLFSLLQMAKDADLKSVAIHLFTDGRDTNPKAAGEIYLKRLEDKIEELGLSGIAEIKTVMGREIAMDRDTAWNKTLTALKALVDGDGQYRTETARDAIEASYENDQTDEFIRPTIVGNYKGISRGDSVVFWNYRQDRGIQLTMAFCESNRKTFNYKTKAKNTWDGIRLFFIKMGVKLGWLKAGKYGLISNKDFALIQSIRQELAGLKFVAMTEYYPGLNALTAFAEGEVPETVGEVVSQAGLKQLRLAGPEKFAHVTGWFSGRRTKPFLGEDRILALDPTLKARTEEGKRYDLVPEMTAHLETEQALKAIESDKFALIVHNFQNGDMVGHTGNLDAAIAAISYISACLEKIVPTVVRQGGAVVLTADHGNADEMILMKKGQEVPSTQHSTNDVPLWVIGADVRLAETGAIPDIAPTVLQLMGLPIPESMTAKSLIV
ncbi:MAG: 2,3-bisphosphoglycerate-independent phosphoglycerate mutase [Candidatus Margulisbacteria bacterium]|nr:2,3-bisphosphoglycerate-independent phosphoglycerate mutase [Candidatus Margulisiibacteriota bacterium]